jgi:hypothetical protein
MQAMLRRQKHRPGPSRASPRTRDKARVNKIGSAFSRWLLKASWMNGQRSLITGEMPSRRCSRQWRRRGPRASDRVYAARQWRCRRLRSIWCEWDETPARAVGPVAPLRVGYLGSRILEEQTNSASLRSDMVFKSESRLLGFRAGLVSRPIEPGIVLPSRGTRPPMEFLDGPRK